MSGSDGQESALIGTTLACAYQIIRPIGEGGMSAVYEAVQLRLNKRVAVKVMAPGLAVNEEALARFRREAEVTSHLGHPHLVTVMDFGTAPTGQPFLVMEYLEGADLAIRIHERGRLPLDTTVHIAKQVASALGAAHDQGVVHRDLKPENVFLVELAGEPDFVKILDFGISKVRAARTQVTAASTIMGTPDYMAPEQATGMLDEIDHRTDQWALACMVWEMLSGRPPFAGDDVSAVFYQIIHLDPQPLGQRVPDLPPAVEAALRRALSKRVTDRFPSIRDFAQALEIAACTRSAEAEPGQVPRNPSVRGNRACDTSKTDSKADSKTDRRMGHRGRRRVDDSPPSSGPGGESDREANGDTFERPSGAAFTGRLRPIVAASIVAAGLVLAAALYSRRADKPAETTPRPMLARATSAEPAVAAPPVATDRQVPVPSASPEPVAAPNSAAVATGSKPKSKGVGPLDTPARSTVRAVKRTAVADATDPFAPTRLASKAKGARRGKADADFVDPFGP